MSVRRGARLLAEGSSLAASRRSQASAACGHLLYYQDERDSAESRTHEGQSVTMRWVQMRLTAPSCSACSPQSCAHSLGHQLTELGPSGPQTSSDACADQSMQATGNTHAARVQQSLAASRSCTAWKPTSQPLEPAWRQHRQGTATDFASESRGHSVCTLASRFTHIRCSNRRQHRPDRLTGPPERVSSVAGQQW